VEAVSGGALAVALERQSEKLEQCVHCGFCLAACPTYTRLGDESDSPRGRLHLMRAVVEGRIPPTSDAFRVHIDRCLGCRACEPVCPSGVEYGSLLEMARATAVSVRPQGLLTRAMLRVFGSRRLRTVGFAGARLLRASGLAGVASRVLPAWGPLASGRLAAAMLASTRSWKIPSDGAAAIPGGENVSPDARGVRVGVLVGCVQEGLYRRVNQATVRVLEANGFEVVTVEGQDCCGALHAHAGALNDARALARRNVMGFEDAGVDLIAVNAAGCGATMKEYDHLLAGDPDFAERAARVAAMVRDVSELLAEAGPRSGAPVPCAVAYDHPCHLLHAQGVGEAPLSVLGAIPDVEVRVVAGAAECCGGAGIYGLTHPDLGEAIGGDKVRSVRAASADAVVTPNPGCLMQIGAGLRLQGAMEGLVHPLELLDESYRRAGYYR
jgi:glycolate oxidase iron-sulfur subunit